MYLHFSKATLGSLSWKGSFFKCNCFFSSFFLVFLHSCLHVDKTANYFNSHELAARRDKKVFLSNQCKEMEENNRMGKSRCLFKKIRDTKGTFHEKMGSIKDRNGMGLTEAEDIRRGGKINRRTVQKRSSQPR